MTAMARHALTFTILLTTVTLGCGSELEEELYDELELELAEAADAPLSEVPSELAASGSPGTVPVADEGVCTDPLLPDEVNYSGGVVEVCAGDVKCACTSPEGELAIMEIVTPQNQCPIIQGWICEPFSVQPGQECDAAEYMAPEAAQCNPFLGCLEESAETETNWSPTGCCSVEKKRTCCCGDPDELFDDIDAISVIG